MLNALQPGSYIQPHRHAVPPKPESLILLRGRLCYLSFSDDGDLDRKFILGGRGDAVGIDAEPGIYHTFFALDEDTVLFEVKPGPYEPMTDKDFATWAPRENSPEAASYLASLYSLVGNAERIEQ
jgi:cupin fold WbuC family metalloprotein